MKNKNTLDSAIEQMKLGSKKGFLSFYRGTVSYVYSSAYLLYKDRDDALRFMEDIYLYMYMNITDYKGDGDVKKWVSREIMERYRQLMIGHEITDVSAIQAMQANAELDKEGRKLLEVALLSHISFPPQKNEIPTIWILITILFLSGVLTLAYLIYNNARPKETVNADILTGSDYGGDEGSENEENSQNAENTDAGNLKTLSEAREELKEYLEDVGEPGTGENTEEYLEIHNEQTDGATKIIEKSSPDTPSVNTPTVDTPTTGDHSVTEPQIKTPQAGENSKSSDTSSEKNNSMELFGKDEKKQDTSEIDKFLEEVEEFQNYKIAD